jgi:hypothetical protein
MVVKRVSLKGQGANLFFGDHAADPAPLSPPPPLPESSSVALRPEDQHASMLERSGDGKAESQQPREPENQQPSTHRRSIKVTYRVSEETVEAIDDIRRLLWRRYHIKVPLEAIAERAILAAYDDLLANQHTSMLVSTLASNPATQHHGQTT